jgi:hypothetical protein
MNEPDLEPILTYLRVHAGRYSLEALSEQLLKNGYAPDEVERAVRTFQEEKPRRRVWPKALKVLLVNALLMAAGVAISFAPRVEGDAPGVIGISLFLLLCVEFLTGVALVFPEKTRTAGLALLLGFLLSVALGILVLSGVCVYSLSHANFH